jgi:hypothetical protein
VSENERPERELAIGATSSRPNPRGRGRCPRAESPLAVGAIVAHPGRRGQGRCLRLEGPLAVGADVAEPDHPHTPGVGRSPVVAPAFGAAVRRRPTPPPNTSRLPKTIPLRGSWRAFVAASNPQQEWRRGEA